MGLKQSRWMMVLAVLGMGVVFLLGASWGQRQEKQEQEANQARLRALLEERQEILVLIADTLEYQISYGKTNYAEYGRARAVAMKAKLDLVKQQAERIEILEEIVVFYKELEKKAKFAKDKPTISTSQYNEVRIGQLEAEIELLREKMK